MKVEPTCPQRDMAPRALAQYPVMQSSKAYENATRSISGMFFSELTVPINLQTNSILSLIMPALAFVSFMRTVFNSALRNDATATMPSRSIGHNRSHSLPSRCRVTIAYAPPVNATTSSAARVSRMRAQQATTPRSHWCPLPPFLHLRGMKQRSSVLEQILGEKGHPTHLDLSLPT